MPLSHLSGLREPFRAAIVDVQKTLRGRRIHMAIFETLRTYSRQDELFGARKSNASAGQSPHNHGLAADFVLNTYRVHVASKTYNGRMVPSAWDRSTRDARTTWRAFGDVVESAGLVWGGRFKFPDGRRLDAHGLGWDLPHVEIKDWRKWTT